MDKENFKILDLLNLKLNAQNELQLRCFAGRRGLRHSISTADINRPGLALNGFFDSFAHERIQLFGRGEAAFVQKLEAENQIDKIENFFGYQIPACVFTSDAKPGPHFIRLAETTGCALLQTSLNSTEFTIRILRVFGTIFAPRTTVHGVLVEVYGVGILITGSAGVGKSETALELVERGHRLVADDVVEIECTNGSVLVGHGANKIIGHHMEIRGLGIINITHLFGVGAVRDRKQIQLICALEDWNPEKVYDRIGSEEETTDILGVAIARLEIPVKPGRNIPIIIETAAMNERLKEMGYHSAKEFEHNILHWLEAEKARKYHFDNDFYL